MFVCVQRKTRTRLYLLSILRSGEKMSKRLGGIKGCKYKNKNQNAPIPSEHPPVRGEKMSKRLGGNVGYCSNCAIAKEGALVSRKGSHWTGPEKYRSTVCQSGPSKRAH